MLKILHVIQGCGGGIASLIGNLIRSADNSVVQQDVMSFSYENGDAFVKEIKERGSRTFLLPRPRAEGLRAFYDYGVKVMKEGGYDVVHCHSDGWRTFLYRDLARRAGVPLFCLHAHRTSNDPGFLGQNKTFIRLNQAISRKNGDILFSCGTDAAQFIYGDVDDYVTIPNGINLRNCQKAACVNRQVLRSALGVEEGQMMLLQVGRLVTQKNHAFTVEIARELKKRGIPFKLLIAGTGNLELMIRQQLQEQELTECVTLLGRRNDILELMAAADAMILPSLYEGLPTVAVEAQAMGLPSLIADTVTAECDMELQLVRFLPIDQGAACWAEAIAACKDMVAPDSERIHRVLADKAYTDEGAVQRYITTLKEKLAKK